MNTLDKLPALQILIVEDDHINQLILSNFIQDMGHQTDIAATGREALQRILERPQTYDLILLDVGLPDYSGIILTTKIRHLCHTQKSQIPIIAVTGHVSATDVENCIQAGMNGFLRKPVDEQQLFTEIHRVTNDAITVQQCP